MSKKQTKNQLIDELHATQASLNAHKNALAQNRRDFEDRLARSVDESKEAQSKCDDAKKAADMWKSSYLDLQEKFVDMHSRVTEVKTLIHNELTDARFVEVNDPAEKNSIMRYILRELAKKFILLEDKICQFNEKYLPIPELMKWILKHREKIALVPKSKRAKDLSEALEDLATSPGQVHPAGDSEPTQRERGHV